jgi:hypothetical protein
MKKTNGKSGGKTITWRKSECVIQTTFSDRIYGHFCPIVKEVVGRFLEAKATEVGPRELGETCIDIDPNLIGSYKLDQISLYAAKCLDQSDLKIA